MQPQTRLTAQRYTFLHDDEFALKSRSTLDLLVFLLNEDLCEHDNTNVDLKITQKMMMTNFGFGSWAHVYEPTVLWQCCALLLNLHVDGTEKASIIVK